MHASRGREHGACGETDVDYRNFTHIDNCELQVAFRALADVLSNQLIQSGQVYGTGVLDYRVVVSAIMRVLECR